MASPDARSRRQADPDGGGRRRVGSRPGRGTEGRRGGLLPDPLDGALAGRRLWGARAPGGATTSSGRHAGPESGGSCTWVGSCPPRVRRPPTWPAGWPSSELLLGATPDSVAFRASIVIGARSRSFRFLVRLVERMPVLVVPAWREHRTGPDRRARRHRVPGPGREQAEIGGRSLDIAGPDVVSYAELIDRDPRRDAGRPAR